MGGDLRRGAGPGFVGLGRLGRRGKHGYAITTDITEQVGVTLGPGTLYAALARLEERGLIEAMPAEGRRRPYRLTAARATALSAHAARTPRLAALSLGRLRLAPA